jgi:uncharacterized protein
MTDTEIGRRIELNASRRIIPVKIVVAGGFGVGKTTLVGAISEITPLTTEAAMTSHSVGVDNADLVGEKTTTTVAMDFGRITVSESVVLYLFGTPGQERFGFMWDELSRGALGAVVMVDSRRISDSFAALDYFERYDIPFVAALNCFDATLWHDIDEVRGALRRPIDRCRRSQPGARQAAVDFAARAHQGPSDRSPQRPLNHSALDRSGTT